MTKSISRLIVGLVVIVLLLSIGINGIQRKRLVDYTERVTTIENTNTQLLTSIENKDAKLVLSDAEILTLRDKNTELESENHVLKIREGHLQASLATISASVDNIPPDSSYAFLKAVYPYKGLLEYSFNKKQVKGIHVTYLENLTLKGLGVNLQEQINNCASRLAVVGTISGELQGQVDILKSEKKDYEEIIVNKSTKNSLLSKQVKKEKRKKTVYKVTTGIAAALVILIAL